MKNDDLYRDIPHEYYDGDVTKSGRLSPEEVKKLADRLLKEGFSKLRQKYMTVDECFDNDIESI